MPLCIVEVRTSRCCVSISSRSVSRFRSNKCPGTLRAAQGEFNRCHEPDLAQSHQTITIADRKECLDGRLLPSRCWRPSETAAREHFLNSRVPPGESALKAGPSTRAGASPLASLASSSRWNLRSRTLSPLEDGMHRRWLLAFCRRRRVEVFGTGGIELSVSRSSPFKNASALKDPDGNCSRGSSTALLRLSPDWSRCLETSMDDE
ncbi:hypothetical protein GE09DRAFT_429022 [Coniochaeta sp. 2T2.1]|nr:hypothetical protein GE09DRAFT_429022 [Coniochaeta sp. 2T2.1]